MKLKYKFSSEVLKARNEQGYTQSEVAEAVSISVRWYQKIESGLKLPSSVVAMRLIVFLNIDVEIFREELDLVEPIHSNKRKLAIR